MDRVFIGDPTVRLPVGEHTYTLTYITDHQVGFGADVDELSWNVTGNFWAFPIENASVTIRPPAGSRAIDVSTVTGPFGARGSNASGQISEIGNAVSRITQPLAPG